MPSSTLATVPGIVACHKQKVIVFDICPVGFSGLVTVINMSLGFLGVGSVYSSLLLCILLYIRSFLYCFLCPMFVIMVLLNWLFNISLFSLVNVLNSPLVMAYIYVLFTGLKHLAWWYAANFSLVDFVRTFFPVMLLSVNCIQGGFHMPV